MKPIWPTVSKKERVSDKGKSSCFIDIPPEMWKGSGCRHAPACTKALTWAAMASLNPRTCTCRSREQRVSWRQCVGLREE